MLDFDKILDIELELTTLCNAKCPLCYRNYKIFNKHYPKSIIRPLDDIIFQLDKFSNLKEIKLVGSISEPTLYPYFFELIIYLKKRNIIIEICTNGDTNNTDWWKQLGTLLSEDDSVYFTICGSTQEIHEVYRKNTKLLNILNNAKSLRESINIDYAQCIRFKYNDDDLNSEEFRIIIKDFSHIYFTETFLHKDIKNYKKFFNINDLEPNISKLDKYKNIQIIANLKTEKNIIKPSCKSYNNSSIQIDIYGNIYPCYLFLEHSHGKLWNQDYSEILGGKYSVCKFCDKNILNICKKEKLEYII